MSVFHGVEGFGASSLVPTQRSLVLGEDLPVAIGLTDSHERIHEFPPQLAELVTEGSVVLDGCEVIRYVAGE